MCVNPASASLVDGINKCKNQVALQLSVRVCALERERQSVHLFTCVHMVSMCNRCEINKSCCGLENIFQIATHLFKTHSGRAARNVINTADGVSVILNVFGR